MQLPSDIRIDRIHAAFPSFLPCFVVLSDLVSHAVYRSLPVLDHKVNSDERMVQPNVVRATALHAKMETPLQTSYQSERENVDSFLGQPVGHERRVSISYC